MRDVTRSRRLGRSLSLSAAVTILLSFAAGRGSATPPPNILLIVTDDQGWTDSSVLMDPDIPNSRSTFYRTPNLEALANAGMRFSNGYAAAPFCTPTRASLLTGKSPAQLQSTDIVFFQQGSGGGLPLSGPIPEPFDPTQTTIPRLVKQANPNYQTALFGKWHLELPTTTTPLTSGFDNWNIYQGDRVADPQGVFGLAQLTNNYMQNAVANGKPFFIELAHDAPHELYTPGGAPYMPARPEIVSKYPNPPQFHKSEYAALLEDMDTSIGQVLAKVNELGIADNTYVIFTSDNGGSLRWTTNAPLRGGKIAILEGGIRVPFMVKGPGIQPGTFSDVPVMTTDLLSTIASLAGYTGSMPTGNEGADISPLLFNGGQLPGGAEFLDREFSQRGEIYFHYPHYASNSATSVFRPASAVRDGDYKLYYEYDETGSPLRVRLHNLETDVNETVNLSFALPQKTAELKAMLDNYLTAVDASLPYDVKTPIQLAWNADQPGADPKGWRSTIDVNYKGRETWTVGAGAEQPSIVNAPAYQPGLSDNAFAFDGDDMMRHVFFHVGDKHPRATQVTNVIIGTPDNDRSASVDMWFRTAGLNRNQVLFEAGDGTSGLSLTMGDADGDGSFNDLRFRIRGQNGQAYDVTAPIDGFANPVADFVNATAVVNDNENNRYLELYVNGALAGRVDVPLGVANSLTWDGYDQAGLGKAAGGLGGFAGAGNLPFNGGFLGQIAEVDFWNHAIAANAIAANYNAKLDPTSLGMLASTGSAFVPLSRPTDLRRGAAETNNVLVFEERRAVTATSLNVDALVSGAASIQFPTSGEVHQLPAGTNFTSYLLHHDPLGSTPGQTASLIGSITFADDIIAILYDGASIAASDAAVGSVGNYGALADRGITWQPGDLLTVSADQRTLNYSLTVPGDEMLQFRVLTSGMIGDFNHDEVVDGQDLAVWQAAFGATPNADADADGDGDSDGYDFLAWQRQLGASQPGAPAASVPEPEPRVLFAVAICLGLLGSRFVKSERICQRHA
jgi:arylsulfatase A-like enzyme